jgi:predicted porin
MKALKKLLAALALTLTTTALAQAPAAPAEAPKAPLYTIYGTLNVNLQYTGAGDVTPIPAGLFPGFSQSGDDVSSRFAVSTDSTNIGIRGTLDATEALKVVYQCETAANLDGVGAAGICGRNSRVGLSGAWGTLFYGNWDTPFKAGTYGTKADDPFGNTDVFGFQGIMGSPGFNTRSGSFNGAAIGTGGVAGFDLRAANSVAYWTPKFSGLSAKMQWSVNEFETANGLVSPTLLGAAVNYDVDGLSLVASAEYHEDAFGLRVINDPPGTDGPYNTSSRASKDMAWRLAAGYELPLGPGAFTVLGMFEQLRYKQDKAAGVNDLKDYDRMAWLLGAKFRMGPHEFRARYAQALEPNCSISDGTDCGSMSDFKAQQFALGYAFYLAKSTQLYASYTQITNDDAASYTLTIGGSPAVAGATPLGADPMALGVGIRYAF